ncbi:hypothetical protein PROCOU_01854 [Listeria rocourtiae FSL F6-920]|nr:hypothetical protein PROCOU_01854 [Listeria rocourtiae FSL F6-920]
MNQNERNMTNTDMSIQIKVLEVAVLTEAAVLAVKALEDLKIFLIHSSEVAVRLVKILMHRVKVVICSIRCV